MATKKPKFFNAIGKFFKDCKSEIKKVVWPTKEAVTRNTLVVLAVIIIIGLFVFGLDTGLLNLLGLFMNVSK